MTLHGRDTERALLESMLAESSAGRGRVLLVRGEPGVGKTALVRDAAARFADARVLHAVGTVSESDLAFAGLHQLLRPLGGVPETADRFEASTAVLSLLTSAAPLLCVVDDAHLFDAPSLEVLGFVGRRLATESVFLLLAAGMRRDDRLARAGFPEAWLTPLGRDDARLVVADRAQSAVSPLVCERLLDAARGNPGALVEFSSALSPAQLTGRVRLPEPLPVSAAAVARFAPRLRKLSEHAQDLLVAVAAEEPADLETIRRLGTLDLDEAEDAGLVRNSHGTLEFTHPLLRSVVYQSARPATVRSAHASLAEGLHGDRRAWHSAKAATSLDPAIADELERTADVALARGGRAAAVDVLEQSAALTADGELRTQRLTRAAEASRLSGQLSRAQDLIRDARRLHGRRAELDRISALIEAQHASPADAFAKLVDISPAEAGELAYGEGDASGQLAVARRLASMRPGPHRFELDVTFGIAELLAGQAADGLQLLRAALVSPGRSSLAGAAALYLGDAAAARHHYAAHVEELRERGDRAPLAVALQWLAFAEIADGMHAAAHEHALEGRRVAEETTQKNCRAVHTALLSWLAAAAGREDEARSLAQEAHRTHLVALPHMLATAALGELELSLGRRDQALVRFEELWRANGGHLVKLLAAPSIVEAAMRADLRDLADEVLEELERWIDEPAPASQRGLLERCRALVADDPAAYAEAIRLHLESGRAFDAARTHLLCGESLRRARRRREARMHLQSAHDAFERLGALGWAARAQRELRGSGATARRGDPSLLDQLTPQELQVARLVAGGATNKQVAARLYLSPRTIDFHLRNIFAKLGITSRFQLSAFAGADDLAEAA